MRAVVLLLALSTIGCNLIGPDEDLTGIWIAESAPTASAVGFTLQQTDDTVSGTACAVSAGLLIYSGAPVTGDYPNVQFTVAASNAAPCCAQAAGLRFSGKQDGTKDIAGTYGTIDLRFKRSDKSLCPQ